MRLFTFPCRLLFLFNVIIFVLCMRFLCLQFIEEKLPIGLIADFFLSIFKIEVMFASTYQKKIKTDSEYFSKIIFLTVWVRYTCFRVSLCLYTIVTFIFSYCCLLLQRLLKVYICCPILRWWWCPLLSYSMFICGYPLSEWYWPSICWI